MTARSRDARRRIGVLAAVTAFWLIDLSVLGGGVPHVLDDTWEYAVSAQHLLAGDGWTTRVIHPPLWSLRDAHLHVPLLIHGPLLTAVFAAGLAGLGPAFAALAAWWSAALAILAALMIERLGTRLAGQGAGIAAALLFTAAPLTIEAVHHDIALTCGAALLAGTLLVLTGGADPARPGVRRAGAAGALLGLGMLVRAEFLVLPPLAALAAGRAGWSLCGASILVALPWWLHAFAATGQPFFNLSSYLLIGYRPAAPELSILRDFDLPPSRWPATLAQAWPELPAKWAETFPRAVKRAAMAPGAAAGWLVAAGGIVALAEPRLRRAAALALLAALVPVAVMTATLYDERYVTPFLPLWALAAAFGASRLAARAPAWMRAPRVWVTLVALLTLPFTAAALRASNAARAADARALAAARAALAPLAHRGGGPPRLMFSDAPDFAAWTTGRPVVWVTQAEHARLADCRPGPRERPAPAPSARGADADMMMQPCQGGPDDVYFRP